MPARRNAGHPPLDVRRYQIVFVLVDERLRHGLFGQFRGHAAAAQVLQNPGSPKPVVFDPHRGVQFGEPLVVEVLQLPEPCNDGLDVGKLRRAAAQLEAQFVRRAGPIRKAANGVVEQCVFRQLDRRLPGSHDFNRSLTGPCGS